jgi:hypothetical protein
VNDLSEKPDINSFYQGQQTYPLLQWGGLAGTLGNPVLVGNMVIDDTNIVVITSITVLTPVLLIGGVYSSPVAADCELTQYFLRVDGKQCVGDLNLGIGAVGLGLPYSMVNYTVRTRLLLRPNAVVSLYLWCIAPSLGAGNNIIGTWIITKHVFDRKILKDYSNFDILKFVKDLGD